MLGRSRKVAEEVFRPSINYGRPSIRRKDSPDRGNDMCVKVQTRSRALLTSDLRAF